MNLVNNEMTTYIVLKNQHVQYFEPPTQVISSLYERRVTDPVRGCVHESVSDPQ